MIDEEIQERKDSMKFPKKNMTDRDKDRLKKLLEEMLGDPDNRNDYMKGVE